MTAPEDALIAQARELAQDYRQSYRSTTVPNLLDRLVAALVESDGRLVQIRELADEWESRQIRRGRRMELADCAKEVRGVIAQGSTP